MSTGVMLDSVMSAFKAPTNYGRYYFVGGVDYAQRFVDKLTQGELRGFGLDGFLKVGEPNPEQLAISFGPFGSKVNVSALFQRLDQLFEIGRLPENRRAEASIAMPNAGHTYILTLFGALKAAGAELSSQLHPVIYDDQPSLNSSTQPSDGFGYDRPCIIARIPPYTDTGQGELKATIDRDDVRLTCGTEVVCQQTRDEDGKDGPITIKELGGKMSFGASLLPRHSLANVGHQVLENGLRAILSPMVEGNAPFLVSPVADSLIVGVRGTVEDIYRQEASEELGIGMDGSVTPSE